MCSAPFDTQDAALGSLGTASAALSAPCAAQASNRVVIYERNGLQHGGFDMPGGGQVAGLAWSPDSQLLAVVVREADGTGEPIRRAVVQVCSVGERWGRCLERLPSLQPPLLPQ